MEECARMNCDGTAVALLTFSPPEAKAWLFDLDQPDPTGGIMLCRKHANGTVVPMSWSLHDGRDPAWPGPAQSTAAMAAPMAVEAGLDEDCADEQNSADEAVLEELVLELPSDTSGLDEEFAALRDDLPVTPQRYEPQLATMRAAGVIPNSDTLVDLGGESTADPSLFELQISDIPAVTPHPNF